MTSRQRSLTNRDFRSPNPLQLPCAERKGGGRKRNEGNGGFGGSQLTANDTVFVVHRRTLNPRIFLVSRTCSRERRGAMSGALEARGTVEDVEYPKVEYSKVHFAFARPATVK
ncbi:hypothetical protein KM043_016590 [Ampulex compressa]|nr:hypothetical protein KM043_016590 [Ampulex compressa]